MAPTGSDGLGGSVESAPPSRGRWPFAFWALLVLGLGLQGWAVVAQSLTGDGAYHLLSGWQALDRGSNLLNLEHPPLLKLWMALPTVLETEPATGSVVLPAEPLDAMRNEPGLFDRLVRLRIPARTLVLLLTLAPLLLLAHRLGHRLAGRGGGANLVLLLLLPFSLVSLYSFLQTDAGLATAAVATVLAAARWAETGRTRWALAAGLAVGLGAAVKHSGLLLGLLLAVMAGVAARRHGRRVWPAFLGASSVALGVLWSSYALANLGYRPDLGRTALQQYARGEATMITGDALVAWEDRLLALERVSPEAAQWLTGILGIREQNRRGVYPTLVAGSIDYDGRWWYFPLVLLLKLPLLILAALAGSTVEVRRVLPARWREPLPLAVLLWCGLYGGFALASNYNLGLRHLLPILPFLLLPVARFLAGPWRRARTAFFCLLAAESLVLAPTWHSATNTWWLGDANALDSIAPLENLDYGHAFLILGDATERLPRPLFVFHPGLSQRALAAHVPGASVAPPRGPLPAGWYAVSRLGNLMLPALCDPGLTDPRAAAHRRWAAGWTGRIEAIEEHGEGAGTVAGRTFVLYRLERRVPADRIRAPPCEPAPSG